MYRLQWPRPSSTDGHLLLHSCYATPPRAASRHEASPEGNGMPCRAGLASILYEAGSVNTLGADLGADPGEGPGRCGSRGHEKHEKNTTSKIRNWFRLAGCSSVKVKITMTLAPSSVLKYFGNLLFGQQAIVLYIHFRNIPNFSNLYPAIPAVPYRPPTHIKRTNLSYFVKRPKAGQNQSPERLADAG